jgi:hypothetical protein
MSRKTLVHTVFPSMLYFIDDSVALLDCGVIGSEAKLVHVRISFGWRFSGLGYHKNLGVLPLYRKVA